MVATPNDVLMVFTINNFQDHYARCMKFIMDIEQRENLDSYINENNDIYKFISEKLRCVSLKDTLRIGTIDEGWIAKCENHLATKPISGYKLSRFAQHVKKDYNHKIYYYFRVENSSDVDVAEFLFFMLMMQSEQIPNERIALYLCPIPDDYSGHKTYGNSVRFSNYASFANHYINNCFAKKYKRISRLASYANETERDNLRAFVPVVEVNSETYRKITREMNFSSSKYDSNETIMAWCKTIRLEPKQAAHKNEFIDRLSKTASYIIGSSTGKLFKKKEKKVEFVDSMHRSLNANGGISALGYILFALTLGEHLRHRHEKGFTAIIKAALESSMVLLDGVSQILENITHHSFNGKGMFAMRLHDYDAPREYVKFKNLDNRGEGRKEDVRKYLQVLIADFNHDGDIISTFMDKKASPGLKKAEGICLADFFGEYAFGSNTALWNEFRTSNQGECLGLLKYSVAMAHTGSRVEVRSSKRFFNTDKALFWARDFNENEAITEPATHYIPGTQYVAFTPMLARLKAGDISDRKALTLAEDEKTIPNTYDTLAVFLDYAIVNVDSAKLLDSLSEFKDVGSGWLQRDKDSCHKKAEAAWDEILKDIIISPKAIVCADMDSLCHPDYYHLYEPACKGLLTSAWSKNRNQYILFKGHTAIFGNIFESTLRAYSMTLDKNDTKLIYQADKLSKVNNASPHPFAVALMSLKDRPPADEYDLHGRLPWEYFIDGGQSFIENELKKYTDGNLLEDGKGYRIENTHIQLGSKVHLGTFYEMAPYFLRQEVSKLIAFYFCRVLLNDEDFKQKLLSGKHICLYGYAAYSRLLVNAMCHMLNRYADIIKEHVGSPPRGSIGKSSISFAIYQPGQAIDFGSVADIHFSDLEDANNNKDEELYIVQIVPISTTLTTFKKMWTKLRTSEKVKNLSEATLLRNLTVLWVRDKEKEKQSSPSSIEKAYWSNVQREVKLIETDDSDGKEDVVLKKPHYILDVYSEWSDPLTCKKCYPERKMGLGMEYPLILTDHSSTMPAQQYHMMSKGSDGHYHDQYEYNINEGRINALYEKIRYGHFNINDNHFQYMINMPAFFRTKKDDIRAWLKKIGELNKNHDSSSVIIISPQSMNNVEFSQYVNDYCYDGNAKMVYINSEKHFRSNFIAEYKNYFMEIKLGKKELSFVFVDASMVSGYTFRRLNSLLSSMRKDAYAPETRDEGFLSSFDKIFILVDRNSRDSKMSFVKNPDMDFHSYVKLHISNLRTFGDSCIGCKLASEAIEFYKISATRRLSLYWWKKVYKNEKVSQSFVEQWEGKEVRRNIVRTKSFLQMICTHYAAFELSAVEGGDESDYFNIVGTLLLNAMKFDGGDRDPNSPFSLYPNIQKAIQAIKNNEKMMDSSTMLTSYMLKALSRPFLSFIYEAKKPLADIVMYGIALIINDFDIDNACKLLYNADGSSAEKYLFSKSGDEWRTKLADDYNSMLLGDPKRKRDFLLVSLKVLSDMHMNFICRKEIIIGVIDHLADLNCTPNEFEEFFDHYICYILRTIHRGRFTSKGLWFEYLLMFHEEYSNGLKEGYEFKDNLDLPLESFSVRVEYAQKFIDVFMILVMENGNALLYDGLSSIIRELNLESLCNDRLKKFLSESHMWDFSRLLLLDRKKALINGEKNLLNDAHEAHNSLTDIDFNWIRESVNLLNLLKNDDVGKSNGMQKRIADERYTNLRDSLKAVLSINTPGCKVDIISKHGNISRIKTYLPLEDFFYVVEPNSAEAVKHVKKHEICKDLNHAGFAIDHGYVIIKLDNHHEEAGTNAEHPQLKNVELSRIAPAYIYIEHESFGRNFTTLLVIRNVLMFRYKLISWLEKDFNDAMESIARMRYFAQLLTDEKAGNHEDGSETDAVLELLMKDDLCGDTESLTAKMEIENQAMFFPSWEISNEWLLLHNYVNTKIARIYRALLVDALQDANAEHLVEGLYRNATPKQELPRGKNILRNLGLLLNERLNLPHGDMSRKRYFRQVLDVVTVKVNGICCYNKDDSADMKLEKLSQALQGYDCITIMTDDGEFGYCSDEFACILLDFLFSAMKYYREWDEDVKTGGITRRYHYLKNNLVNGECVVEISRCGKDDKCNIFGFDYLVLKSKTRDKADNGKVGMSVPASKWYADVLWTKMKNKPNNTALPGAAEKRLKAEDDEIYFTLKLPILRKVNNGR